MQIFQKNFLFLANSSYAHPLPVQLTYLSEPSANLQRTFSEPSAKVERRIREDKGKIRGR